MLLDLAYLSPVIILAVVGLLVLIAGVFAPKDGFTGWLGYVAVAGMALALVSLYWVSGQGPIDIQSPYLGSSVIVDGFALALSAVILIGAIISTLAAIDYLPEQRADHAEFYSLITFSASGLIGMVMARDLLTLFVCLEVGSIAVYILAGFKRRSAFSTESALKYFILGSFASALLLLGIAYTYGVTGHIDLVAIGQTFAAKPELASSTLSQLALLMLLGAFAFKIAAAPFHMWTPDVYEGAPSPVSGFMAVAVKTAGFGALARLLLTAFGDDTFRTGPTGWETIIAGLAVLSMVVGNLMALSQRNLKRMLAYSAIAHTGYLLIALLTRPAATAEGTLSADYLGGGLIFYLLAYTLANAGAFAVASAVSGDNVEDVSEPEYAGLAKKSPALALALAVCMLSLLGIPATAGFVGKLTIFDEALRTGPAVAGEAPLWLWLVIVAVANSVISAWYYLRVIMVAYMRDEVKTIKVIDSSPLRWAAGLAAIGTVVVGLLPSASLEATDKAGQSLARTTVVRTAPAATPGTKQLAPTGVVPTNAP